MEPTHCNPEIFKAAMRTNLSAVHIATTTTEDGSNYGVTISSFTSVSADEPSVLISINKNCSFHNALLASKKFAINTLCEGANEIAMDFSGQLKGSERFVKHPYSRNSDAGCPILVEACSIYECIVEQVVEVSTHTIFIARVHACDRFTDQALSYGDGKFGKFVPDAIPA